MRLITRDQALAHLRVTVPELSPQSLTDLDLVTKIEIAEELVIDFVDQRRIDADLWSAEVAAWDVESTVAADQPPKRVQAAVLVQLAELYRFRGDDVDGDQPVRPAAATLHPRAEGYLLRLRDPAVS